MTAIPSQYRATLERAAHLHRQGHFSEAERLYRSLLDADLLHLFGMLRAQQGHTDEALALLGAALQANSQSATILSNRGEVLVVAGRLEEAVAHFDAAITLEPANAAVRNLRGNALQRLGWLEQALESHAAALAIAPQFAQAFSDRGSVLYDLGQFAEALNSYDAALAIQPDFAQALSNRGQTLLRLGRLDEALNSFDQALQHAPHDASTLTNRGVVLREQMRLPEALDSFSRAMAVDPNYANAFYNAAAVRLLTDDFAEGWPLYEWRKQLPVPVDADRDPRPVWTGAEDLSGKTLFLHSGQGLGDTIQFFRYAMLARARRARVILSAQDSLRRILEQAGHDIEIVGAHTVPEDFDYQASLLSLPLAFGTTLETVPANVPYLKADAARAATWRDRIGEQGFRIGICWQGRPGTLVDIGRSIPLRQFQALAPIRGVRLISLQKGVGREQLADLAAGVTIETLPSDFDAGPDAFLDSAALMQSLDLVITSDTAVAHLAGALGRPVWVALQYVPEWRWLLNREDSPWYPSMSLVRQTKAGDWDGVFSQMESRLRKALVAR
ncbi:MAG TPA: tetratricopeptide repeat-containing glycosyltransferase family protein [Rhizomicrobium sp.]|jgi:tetratricopeptide (TPR) repeat protein